MDVLLENILNIGDDEFYRSARYKSPLVVLLINSTDKSACNMFKKNTRQTDIVEQLTSNLTVVFLSHTDKEHSIAFLDKVKEQLDFTYTMSEYEGSEFDFIHDLYVNNIEKHDKVIKVGSSCSLV